MPALPHLYHPAVAATAATATDTRSLDARQFHNALDKASELLVANAERLVKRIARILPRQAGKNCLSPGVIASCYQGLSAGPTPGAVVGIVLGSIAGFLFLLWILWVLSNGTSFIRTSALEEEEVVVRRRSRSPRSRRSHRSTYNAEMRHSSPRRDRVIRQERIVRESVPPPREVSRIRETVILEDSRPERRVEGDDIVEVFEEHSSIGGAPPPRRKSRKNSSYR